MEFKEYIKEVKQPKEILLAILTKAEKGLKEVRTNIEYNTDRGDRFAKSDLKKATIELKKLDKGL